MKTRVIGLCALLLVAVLSAPGQSSSSTSASGKASSNTVGTAFGAPGFQERNPRYEICPGDTFDVVFEFTPEFNQTLTVQPDGYITLRAVGDRHVSGQTVPQLTATLRAAYAKILKKPVLTVVLKDFEKPFFIADGQVSRPGKYELRGDTTVIEALAMAGGMLDSAKHSQVVLFRRVSDNWTEAKVLNIKQMEQKRNLQEDVHLRPGDMVFVPKNTFSKFARFIPTANLNTVAKTY